MYLQTTVTSPPAQRTYTLVWRWTTWPTYPMLLPTLLGPVHTAQRWNVKMIALFSPLVGAARCIATLRPG